MKKLIALICFTMALVSLCACGKKAEEQNVELPEEPVIPEEMPEEPEEQKEEPVHEHRYKKTMKVPDCYEGGYTDYTCACGDTYRVEGAQPIGHSYVDEVVAPTYV